MAGGLGKLPGDGGYALICERNGLQQLGRGHGGMVFWVLCVSGHIGNSDVADFVMALMHAWTIEKFGSFWIVDQDRNMFSCGREVHGVLAMELRCQLLRG